MNTANRRCCNCNQCDALKSGQIRLADGKVSCLHKTKQVTFILNRERSTRAYFGQHRLGTRCQQLLDDLEVAFIFIPCKSRVPRDVNICSANTKSRIRTTHISFTRFEFRVLDHTGMLISP